MYTVLCFWSCAESSISNFQKKTSLKRKSIRRETILSLLDSEEEEEEESKQGYEDVKCRGKILSINPERQGEGGMEERLSNGSFDMDDDARRDTRRSTTVTPGRMTTPHNRKRVSAVLLNDNDQYLNGYGESYGNDHGTGEQESKVEMTRKPREQRPLERQTSTQGSTSPKAKSKDTNKQSKKVEEKLSLKGRRNEAREGTRAESPLQKAKKLFPRQNPQFTKQRGFTSQDILHQGEESIEMTASVREIPPPGLRNTSSGEGTMNSQHAAAVDQRKLLTDSMAMNTSVGSTEEPDSEEESGGVSLPLQRESVDDQVRRLQQSVQEYAPETLEIATKVSDYYSN